MEQDVKKKEYIHLDCAFNHFFALRYPINVRSGLYPSNHANALHNHDFPQVWYCRSGEYAHRVGEQIYKCKKGSVVTIPPGVFHQISFLEGEEAELVHLNVMYDIFLDTPPNKYINAIANLFLSPFQKELGHSLPTCYLLSQQSQSLFEEHLSWFAALNIVLPSQTPHMDICERLESMFSMPEFVMPEQFRKKAMWLAQMRVRPMIRVISFLNVHYPEKITEEDFLLAATSCRTDLYWCFKRFTGYTCSQYLQWLRTKHAFTYLTYTTYPLSYISDVCGFTNQAYMSRVFCRYMGITPREFRSNQRKRLDENPQKRLHLSKF